MSVNPILQYFVPKDRKFYPLFEQASANLVAISKVLVEALTTASIEKRTSLIREIEKLEHVGDEITHKIFQEVSTTFITPFDREDIHLMAVNIDRALDIINSSAQKLDMYGIRKVPANIVNFADIVMEMSLELQKLMKQFKNKEKVEEMVTKLHNFENKADYLFRISLADLFNNGTNAIEIIKFKEIYEHLEDLTDCIDFIGKTVRGITVKQG